MLHGKKGFERIVWAFKNVLNKPMTWLFYDFDDKLGTFDNGVSNNGTSRSYYSIENGRSDCATKP
jgi:ribonuclease P/MRP protein subunit RPP40